MINEDIDSKNKQEDSDNLKKNKIVQFSSKLDFNDSCYNKSSFKSIEEQYRTKIDFLENRSIITKKILSRGEEYIKIRKNMINYNIDLEEWRYRFFLHGFDQTTPIFVKQFQYERENIPFSPILMYHPDEVNKKCEKDNEEEGFYYYKKHILLENYDEESESNDEINNMILKFKNSLQIGELKDGDCKILGFTSWFDHNGIKTWKECEFLNYDSECRLFTIKLKKKNSEDMIKKVTRFNLRFKQENEFLFNKRIKNAERRREIATKYMALNHLISSNSLEDLNIPKLINQIFKNRIIYLTLYYNRNSKTIHQLSPIEYLKLPTEIRYGIWQRNVRQKDLPPNDLINQKCDFLRKKDMSKYQFIDNILREFEHDYYCRCFQIMKFEANLPLDINFYKLLKDIVDNKKFLIPSERYLYPCNNSGIIQFERSNDYIDSFKSVENKLHQSDRDTGYLLIDLNKKFKEDFKDKIFFYTKWLVKPIDTLDFFNKNVEHINSVFKDIKFIIGHSNYEIINFIKLRLKEAKKINKGARYLTFNI